MWLFLAQLQLDLLPDRVVIKRRSVEVHMKCNIWNVLATIFFAANLFAHDKPIKFSDLPMAVQKIMLRESRATGARIKNTLIEVEGGKTYYECESIISASGKTRDFLVDPQGNVYEIEDEVEESEVPAAVKAVIDKAAAGGGKITKLEAVKHHGKITGYEATVVKNGKKTSLELKPDGTSAK
jgi:hypothetical protein